MSKSWWLFFGSYSWVKSRYLIPILCPNTNVYPKCAWQAHSLGVWSSLLWSQSPNFGKTQFYWYFHRSTKKLEKRLRIKRAPWVMADSWNFTIMMVMITVNRNKVHFQLYVINMLQTLICLSSLKLMTMKPKITYNSYLYQLLFHG